MGFPRCGQKRLDHVVQEQNEACVRYRPTSMSWWRTKSILHVVVVVEGCRMTSGGNEGDRQARFFADEQQCACRVSCAAGYGLSTLPISMSAKCACHINPCVQDYLFLGPDSISPGRLASSTFLYALTSWPEWFLERCGPRAIGFWGLHIGEGYL